MRKSKPTEKPINRNPIVIALVRNGSPQGAHKLKTKVLDRKAKHKKPIPIDDNS